MFNWLTGTQLPPAIPNLSLDDVEDEDEQTSSEEDTQQPSAQPSAQPTAPTRSSSLLHPSTAHAARPPSSPFKAPSAPNPPQAESTLNMFPALDSTQRASSTTAPSVARKKVPLAPGHSPLDWARLKSSNTDLRGVRQLDRYTLEDIAQHKTRNDVWMAIQGKVYNVTSYLKFHPGGAGQLMRGAGKDATDLFLTVHAWVNVDALLDKCLVGFLIKDKPPGTTTDLD
ncbi:hypothetical protein HK097_000191 [Rhizophlyctis rosea]|uniref:Cytochrome b5 heme-binding domain-containing protein n=1 Tax=Rhizophlyctis rosea TaxID=64517 RepID=A0AAD5SGN4_9FUNG|nr:hypothetical protein HK097_000191 [Rhizophlyctis rosea]